MTDIDISELQAPGSMSPVRVCLIDDDKRILDKLGSAFESREEIELLGTATGVASGFELLAKCSPDIVLVDLGLLDGSGLEIIRHVHQHMPDAEAVVLTVFGDEAHVMRSIEAGATGYLTKDTQIEDIVRRLYSIRAGGSPISPVVARQLLNRFRMNDESSDQKEGAAQENMILSEREREVLNMVSKGFIQSEIAQLIGVSQNTVSTYVKRIYRKLSVNSKIGAVKKGKELGLINFERDQ